jgi:L-aspartate oxidase
MNKRVEDLIRNPDRVVIVGGGLTGLFCALKLAPRPVTLIAAARPLPGRRAASRPRLARATARRRMPPTPSPSAAGSSIEKWRSPSPARHPHASATCCITAFLSTATAKAGSRSGREAAHSARRIVHVRGDMAGQAIIAALTEAVRHTPSVRVIEGYAAEALLTEDNAVAGLQVRKADDATANPLIIASRAVVLATGGIGHLYAVTTNPKEASGQGLAIAASAGAVIADPEFVQFHPTAIMAGRDPAPLATEALRGEGATLINGDGERFMPARHPLAELAPRDIVARGVFAEIASGRGAFLDAREALGARFAEKFPAVHASCVAGGIDPARQPIPIAPAAHYHMGGVAVDARGRSSIDGLWAGGEVSSTGAHGANRLASNSLLEAEVYAARIADDIASRAIAAPDGIPAQELLPRNAVLPALSETALRGMMTSHVGVVRDGDRLAEAVRAFARLERDADSFALRNMARAALLVAASAWTRRESRGAHCRSDYAGGNNALPHRNMTTLAAAQDVAAKLNDRAPVRAAQPMIA